MKTKEVIVTISKAKFDKMSKAKQRIAVAKDVLDRIKFGQFKGVGGVMISSSNLQNLKRWGSSVSQELQCSDFQCCVCAKGGLFMAHIGIVNGISFNDIENETDLDSKDMQSLEKIFSRHQLSLIETAFERDTFDWNDKITHSERNACIQFYKKHNTGEGSSLVGCNADRNNTNLLAAICKNIIKNNGTFKP